MMNFLKRLFGGGGGTGDDKRSFYVYVRPKRCDEIVEVRIDLLNELSQEDTGKGYFVRKIARGTRCPFPAELLLRFNQSRRAIETQIKDGEVVTAEEYEEWLAAKAGSTTTSE